MKRSFRTCLIAGGYWLTMTFSIKMFAQKQKAVPAPDPYLVEQTEVAAWKDLIDAAPDTFKAANGMKYFNVGGGLAINFQKMPIPLFNRVIGLGLSEPVTQEVIDQITGFYTHGEKYLIHYSSPMKPADTDSLLKRNGFYLAGSWERIVRGNEPLPTDKEDSDITVLRVDSSLKEAWAKFLIDTYDFDFYVWPRSFCLRKGWRHYIAMNKEHQIVACRSFFLTDQHTIFSGVDAPVPGIMTSSYKPDFAIWRRAIRDGIKDGAILFVADIELPDKIKNKQAYDGFRELGFQIPYTRYHYRLNR